MKKYLLTIAAMLAIFAASAQNEKYVNMFLCGMLLQTPFSIK